MEEPKADEPIAPEVAERIKQIIAELDQLIPREGAAIKFQQYGGDVDESGIHGNACGYLRFGIEMLKAAFQDENDEPDLFVDLDYLISPTSRIRFDFCSLEEDIATTPPVEIPERERARSLIRDKLALVGCAALIFCTLAGFAMCVAAAIVAIQSNWALWR